MISCVKGLVTVLTPAYNMESYIGNLLDSVLYQTYSQLEMIVVDDGSTDGTRNIVDGYIRKFEKKGYRIKYYYQNNQGQSSAINYGLKKVEGEYLVWPDSDDWYSRNDALERMVETLSRTDDRIGLVRCAYNRVSEDKNEIVRIDYPQQYGEPINLFECLIKRERNVWIEPGGWMVKTKFLEELLPNRSIYTSKNTGQNYQILLPYLYSKKCVAIEEPLFSYLIRKASHSRGQYDTYEKEMVKHQEVWTTQIESLKSIKVIPAEKLPIYIGIVDKRMTYSLCLLYFKYNRQWLFVRGYFKLLKHYKTLYSYKLFTLFICSLIPCSFRILNHYIGR